MSDRFVVRCVTGWAIGPTGRANGKPAVTKCHVADSRDCYRVVYVAPFNSPRQRFLTEREAARLNAEHAAHHAA